MGDMADDYNGTNNWPVEEEDDEIYVEDDYDEDLDSEDD